MNRKITLMLIAAVLLSGYLYSEKKNLTPQDIMKFKFATQQQISNDGNWITWVETPDRGDGALKIKSITKDTTYTLERGTSSIISKNSKWIACSVLPKSIESENADKEKPKNSMALFNTITGKSDKFENISKFIFSNDSKWFAYQVNDSKKGGSDNKDKKKRPSAGSPIFLRHLETGSELNFQNVTEFTFDSISANFSYIISEESAKKNGIYNISLTGSLPFPIKVIEEANTHYSGISWNHKKGLLAYVSGKEKKNGQPDSCEISFWSSDSKIITKFADKNSYPKDWFIPFKNNLKWTKDGDRLFFGYKPLIDSTIDEETITFADSNYYDINQISKKTELDLWHWNDPRIKTNQRNWWEKNKDFTYTAVYHLNTKKIVQLADLNISSINFNENPQFALGISQTPYMKEMTWKGPIYDLYLVNIVDGTKKLVEKEVKEDIELSPFGKCIAYFKNKNWYLYDNYKDTTVNLTERTKFVFWDDESDVPDEPGSFGSPGWLQDDDAILINSKYDVWSFFTGGNYGYLIQTANEGKLSKTQIRVVKLDPEKEFYTVKESVYFTGFSEEFKSYNLYTTTFSILGTLKLTEYSDKKLRLIAKAKNTESYIFTKESYDEFPDLWISDSTFSKPSRISEVNPQMKDFNWGKTSLVKWKSYEGFDLDGFVIKPDNFDPKKKYALLVYYYDRFSNTMNTFYQPRLNHRPCYQWYQNDGYIIFVPDIKYNIGNPGNNAVSCVVSGVRELLKQGYIDSTAIAIQGHSWGGYQTAYMITKTNLFAAACAGAPVGNMTSAYSGIRLESGLARQMQYEHQQSRIGGTLWDSLSAYINNSPVFQASTVKTPFLIMFGDIDDAVPWQQGIELYLAMRRLNKNCVMLQYRNEPHIPRRYPNKMDYALKMKEFFDTYCLKKTAPDWLLNGIEYRGK